MFRGILLSVVMLCGLATVQASELDRDMSNIQNPELEGTVVLKVNKKSGAMEVLKSKTTIRSEKEALALVKNSGKFVAVAKENVRSELDSTGGSSSWYFWNRPSYSYNPYYYCYNNYYQPYYTYNYSYYSYYYYGSYYRW